ncbi:hypothetical protein [Kitasatospora sp. HPMI-4]|uniref:hypothetical protein n=1 Tax=Kitasatospora sp. HPMI-4 TaxID=3448443 RepID=UPI003F1C3677
MNSAKVQRPHYLPAALIGGFGIPDARQSGARYASVLMRRRDEPGKLRGPIRADQVAVQNGLYDVDEPYEELPADFAETLWQRYETALPGAVQALEAGTFSRADWHIILLHIQAQSVRSPDFDRVATAYLIRQHGTTPLRDHIQRERQRTHQESRRFLAQARYAVIRRAAPAQRFVLNDKGYTGFQDPIRATRGLLFPLSGNLAVLMALDTALPGEDYEDGPIAERTLNPASMAIANACSWGHSNIKCVIGHPDEAEEIAALSDTGDAISLPKLGPFRGTREPGLLDWAL